jgi:hypothetical protein
MLLTLVTVFLVCWLPIQIFNLTIWLFQDLRNPDTYFQYYLYFGLYFTFHLLSQFHTFLNPFIYCFMTNNFTVSLVKTRIAFKYLNKDTDLETKYSEFPFGFQTIA